VRALLLLLFAGMAFSLTLEEVKELALKKATEVRLSELDLKRAKEELRRAYGAVLPRLTFTYSYTHLDKNLVFGFGIRDRQEFSFSLLQTLFNAGVFRNISLSGKRKELAKLVLEDVKKEVLYKTEDMFYALLYKKRLVELERDNLAYWEAYVKLVEEKYKAGLLPKVELVRARAQLESAKAALEEKLTDYQNSLEEFRAFLRIERGEPEGKLDFQKLSLSEEKLLKELFEKNSSYAVAKKSLEVLEEAVKAAKAQYYPSLEAFADYRGFTGRKTLYGGKVWIKGYSVGVRFNYNLFDGFSREAQIALAKVDLMKEREKLKDLRFKLKAELKKTLHQLRSLERQIEATEASLRASKESLRLSTERYRHGVATYLEVLESRTNYNETVGRLYFLLYRYKALSAYLRRLTR